MADRRVFMIRALTIVLLAASLATAALAEGAPPPVRPVATSEVGPWEIVVWGAATRVHQCTLVRAAPAADAPKFGILVDHLGMVLSVDTAAWQLTPQSPVASTLRPQVGQGRAEPVVEHPGAQAAGDLPQVAHRLGHPVHGLVERPGRLRVVVNPPLDPPQGHAERHQALLGAVVQVALQPPALLVARAHDPGAALLHLVQSPRQLAAQAGHLDREGRRPQDVRE